ncbi:MAG: FAD-dependent oxidoreductase [Methylobacteriaceae bacterium]|nr:FAD-dependent oxidoreductase [Methylobacteriaceae bacterium]
MTFKSEVDVAIVGAGAAGLAAAHDLGAAGLDVLLVEARDRIGGRAWTLSEGQPCPLDLGCGWLHSADVNPWVKIAEELGFHVDKSLPPWARRSREMGFAPGEYDDFFRASESFWDRLEDAKDAEHDRPASDFLEQGSRWIPLIESISSYYNGAALDLVSTKDLGRYTDTGVNWRVVEGYGTLVARYGADLPVAYNAPASAIDHHGSRVKIETSRGTISARAAVITVPTGVLASGAIAFRPALDDKLQAAAHLPLGLADKMFFRLQRPEDFPNGAHLFGAIDELTASYDVRPHGCPIIECYFGGSLAADLEKGAAGAFESYAREQLTRQLGGDVVANISAIASTRWQADPFARGSYSHALPGHADDRSVLAAPVGDRLFFAGEACSPEFFSTAHGAYLSGIDAARQVRAALEVRATA